MNNFRKWREEKVRPTACDYRQSEVARMIGVTQRTIEQWETGHGINSRYYAKIELVTGKKMIELFPHIFDPTFEPEE